MFKLADLVALIIGLLLVLVVIARRSCPVGVDRHHTGRHPLRRLLRC